ncbi:MAG TPA: hypothetical protein PLL75_02750 [Candidatus Omnitrophota bacterium]|nr:hypothetical protein [Candidatus Omnitrophota bacterium]HPS36631.1 hypothetical protein [Candidatus Omnitrophota bacterium]
MDRLARSFFLFLTVILCSFSVTPQILSAGPAPQAELESVLQKIENRHYRWVAIRAEVLLFFAASENSRAMCGGELIYQRLDERMSLSCVDSEKNLVFVFRTLDRRFDLYFPSQNTIYHGSIFDMEDSPEIESHLKPRDLYRALKPMAVNPKEAGVERTNSVITSLDVYGKKRDGKYLKRKLYLTPEGDVRGELFFNSDGKPVTEIQRYDFREIPADVGTFHSVIFPKKITVISPETKKGSAIFFARVQPLDSIDPLEFLLRVPEGTKEVFLDEKDPKLAFRQMELDRRSARSSEVGPVEKIAPEAVPVPEKPAQEIAPEPSPEPAAENPETSADADIAISEELSAPVPPSEPEFTAKTPPEQDSPPATPSDSAPLPAKT